MNILLADMFLIVVGARIVSGPLAERTDTNFGHKQMSPDYLYFLVTMRS